MKKILLFATALLLTIPFNVIYADGDDPIEIIIGDGGSMEGGPTYHAPAFVPILGIYSAVKSSVLINYLYDLGTIVIEIENQTTGEYSQSLVNALAGPMLLPISGTAGQWTITFTLPSGVVYYGEFII
ncbi:MAG: hypothetical protein IJQ93_11570 [Bacteroidales bacterium]|nr:hypothetical protein [Bacteroidales bacterium]MBR0300939.1 hypothetical protein [Bacteroidales bacterium]